MRWIIYQTAVDDKICDMPEIKSYLYRLFMRIFKTALFVLACNLLNATATTRSDRSTAITVHPSLMTSLKTNCISSGAPGSSNMPMPIAMHSCRMECCCTVSASSILSLLSILNSMAPVRSVPRLTGMMRSSGIRLKETLWHHYSWSIHAQVYHPCLAHPVLFFFPIKRRFEFNERGRFLSRLLPDIS